MASARRVPTGAQAIRQDGGRMRARRLLITGASGSGTTTLGRALASLRSVPHADVDDYFWIPTSPPYTHKRPAEERLALMNQVFLPRDSWILSGSVVGWGDSLVDLLDGIVFLTVEPRTRMDRLLSREVRRYGNTIEPGGSNEAAHHDFMDWARGYDDDQFSGRRRAEHERWMAELRCPVLRLDSAAPVLELIDAVEKWLNSERLPDGRGS
ncbi:AAA family ATPase [Nocardia sp. NPDC057455]|uniref:AAA family ATPase n=1 Tax=Nocardia sp. NPDC057455 TaxID=3346138 RepID=UPI003672149C